MAKVIEFKRAKNGGEKHPVSSGDRHILKRFCAWFSRALVGVFWSLIRFLRAVLLTLLIWFRPILFFVIQPLSGLLLIAFIVCLFIQPDDTRLTWGFGLMTFGAFLIMHLYDSLLIFLTSGNAIRILD
jgi:hypothetical protein